MPDLLAAAARPYIRISEWSNCDLRIGHSILQSERRQRQFGDVSLRMGSHLEPMIVEYMADQGFTLYFTGNDQLEVATQDPYALGHPDGLIVLESPDQLTRWARYNIPEVALAILSAGSPMMFEAKTMNEGQFKDFLDNGLEGNSLIAHYVGQIQGYLHVLANPDSDELWPTQENTAESCPIIMAPEDRNVDQIHWGSDSYRDALKERGLGRPTSCFVAVLCPGTRKFAFTVVYEDKVAYQTRAEELEINVILPMREGRMPEPSHDGQATECFWCPYSYDCPAVQKVMADRILDDVPTTVATNQERLDELASDYYELGVQISELTRSREVARDKIREIIGNDKAKLVTSNYYINQYTNKGRRNIDRVKVANVFGGKDNIPYKTGRGSTTTKVLPLYGPTARDEDNDKSDNDKE